MKFQNKSILLLPALKVSELWYTTFAFSPSTRSVKSINKATERKSLLFQTIGNEEDHDNRMENLDWRAFRAQLVLSELKTKKNNGNDFKADEDMDGIGTIFYEPPNGQQDRNDAVAETNEHSKNLFPGQPWGYDPGTVIEKGSIILGGVEQECGFGLRQQFFHKSAMLIINHDDAKYTKAVILNRPTDLSLVDEDGNEWNVWYGGMSQNINHSEPEIVCLHTLSNPSNDALLNDVSVPIMNELQYCTLEQAQMLVREGIAKTSDFWAFAGYSAWTSGQLESEIQEKSWYMCTTDTQTIVRELSRQKLRISSSSPSPMTSLHSDSDNSSSTSDAGIEFWTVLMELIGRGETANECEGDFEDLILKEWTNEHLLSNDAGGYAGLQQRHISDKMYQNNDDASSTTLSSLSAPGVVTKAHDIGVGSLVRASSNDRSPYLLKDQVFHKAVVLILHEDEDTSVGIILNQPSTQEVDLEFVDRQTGQPTLTKIPVRFGGLYAQDENSLMWLHHDIFLSEANVGSPLDPGTDSIWKCTQEEAVAAINAGLAEPSSFLVVNGLSVWKKSRNCEVDSASPNGMIGQVEKGNFEMIDPRRTSTMFSSLVKQRTLNWMNLMHNLKCGEDAWRKAGGIRRHVLSHNSSSDGEKFRRTEQSNHERRRLAKLSDDALKSWVATFLLGSPTLGA